MEDEILESNVNDDPEDITDHEVIEVVPEPEQEEDNIPFVEDSDSESLTLEDIQALLEESGNSDFDNAVIQNLQFLNQSNDLIVDYLSNNAEYYETYQFNSQFLYDQIVEIERLQHTCTLGVLTGGFLLACCLGVLLANFIMERFK